MEELAGLKAENVRLERELLAIGSQLDEARQNASVSAECGLKLMEMNQDLEQRLEDTTKEFTLQIEVREERFCLLHDMSFSRCSLGTQAGKLHSPIESQRSRQDR